MPIWEKFGFYRAAFNGQQTWNAQRGSVESGKNYNITRFNIWKESMREGVAIPIEQREPKPIIYYTNVHHPDNLLKASRRVEQEWNQTFKEMVFFAQPGKYKSISDVPDMWILRENDCRVSNVENWLKQVSPDIRKKVAEASKRDLDQIRIKLADVANPLYQGAFTTKQDIESQAKSDLERVCSALESFTEFKYQRPGDLRYNLLNLVVKRAPTNWSGLGPMLADIATGEIIQATANVNLWYIDRRAALASEQIDIMMGNVAYNDIMMGADVRQYMSSKLEQIREASKLVPSKQALDKMGRHFDSLAKSGLLLETSSQRSIDDRLSKIANTHMEKKMFMSRDSAQPEDWLILQKMAPGGDLPREMMRREKELSKQVLGIADPAEFLDRLVLGVALQYKDLKSRERFMKIREDVYIATMLHEVGHNMGLGHNMAGSNDSLNYGKAFWDIQALPIDPKAALAQTQDVEMRQILAKCVDAGEKIGVVRTADCLGQAGTMYSSIMDYHSAWNSSLAGLGAYDKAAIKFGYAQLAEVFPKANIKTDKDLSRWLFLNDWRRIPTDLVTNIHERQHVKYDWAKNSTNFKAPSNEVPYKYCIDSSGAYGPTCKAFDFGPDMRAQAEWNQINYWQYYVLTHFARDRLWSYEWDFQNVVQRDLSVFVDFNNIMRWYYYYSATDPEFKGSDAEKDYLAAVVAGLNHYGQVLGHPAPGEHVSTPVHMVESIVRASPRADRLQASSLLVPWGSVDACTRLNVSEVKEGKKRVARPGYIFANVPLGEGRPFYVGLNHDYEDWHVNFVGSFYAKLYAGFFLAYPGAWFPRSDTVSDPRFYNINWYRLFPKEVAKVYQDIITQNWTELGPVVSPDGSIFARNILDPETLQAPDYSKNARILPSTSTFLPFRAMFFASSMLSGYRNSEMDVLKMMRVSLKGSEDDLSFLDSMNADDVAIFEHPVSGYTYRAIKAGTSPIAYELVDRLNNLKEKYTRLNQCVNDENARSTDRYCRCVRTTKSKSFGGAICCHPGNPDCPSIGLQKVGDDNCPIRDLMQRRDRALEDVDDAASFLDDMRWFVKTYSNLP
jgi:hypothetical protein